MAIKKTSSLRRGVKNDKIVRSIGKYFDEFKNVRTWNTQIVTETWLGKLAEDLRTWAEFEGDSQNKIKEAYRFQDFLDSRGIPKANFELWMDRYPELKEAHSYALRRLASRREYGAATGRYKPEVIKWTACLYDEDVRRGLEMLTKIQSLPDEVEAAASRALTIIDMAKRDLENIRNPEGKE